MKSLRAAAFAALLPVAFGAGLVASEKPASASVVIAITFESLVRQSSAASVATPVEQRSVWENGRIYTYTRVHVERPVAGGLGKDQEAWVRTLGGVVGNIGQTVDGEAVLTVGRPSLVFLHEAAAPSAAGASPGASPSAFEVTARAQGQFPVVAAADKSLRLMRSRAIGVTLPPKTGFQPGFQPKAGAGKLGTLGARGEALAADVLSDRPVDDVAKEVAEAWSRVHTP